jgi:NADPH-dependent 2,4-dienoyl-CoA reductase/sulfur reductase-like enzyme/rhodanese-related sulfurtransferase
MKEENSTASTPEKIVIVGGVAGGATALGRLRRQKEDLEIVLFERGEYVSFANCGLPYYIGGEIETREALFVATEASIEKMYNVDIRTQSEVVAIDRANKSVEVEEKVTGRRYTETYDRLLLTTGASPIRPRLPGVEANNVFTLWTIPDTDKVKRFIEENSPKRAVVVGGGFVGLEMVENFVELGLSVTLVEMAEQVLAPLDPDMSILIENRLRDYGVDVRLNMKLEGIEEGGKAVRLADGSTVETDLTLLCLGISPNSKLAADAGLELNARRAIAVDEFMCTSDPSIYAVGDVVEVTDFTSGEKTMVPLAGPANRQGRLVADIMLGRTDDSYDGTLGTSILRVFDTVAASTGLNEKALNRLGRVYGKDYFVALIHPLSHAGYFPGGHPLTFKLIFAADGKVLGSQIVGCDGADKRIDVIATAMRFGATVSDLTKLELAYAPPFSSAKDPVNMAGYVAENILTEKSDPVLVRELDSLPDDHVILDVRDEEELSIGKVRGSVNLPLGKLRAGLGRLDKDKTYVICCAVGRRGYIAEQILKQSGFRAKNLLGGYRSYFDAHVRDKGEPNLDDWKVLESGKTVFVGDDD